MTWGSRWRSRGLGEKQSCPERWGQYQEKEETGIDGAALSHGLREGRDGAVDSAVIREEVSELGGAPRARGATSGEEVKESTYTGVLKAVDGLGRVFWSHSPSGVTPKLPMGGVLWPESGGHNIYQDSDHLRQRF